MLLRNALAAASAIVVLAGAAIAETRNGIDDVIVRLRHKLTAPMAADDPKSVWASGSGKSMGMDMRATFSYNDTTGHFAFFGRGRVTVGSGYDGTTTWRHNANGDTRAMQMNNAHYVRSSHWLISGYWLHPSAPYEFGISNHPVAGEEMAIRVRLTGSTIDGVMVVDTTQWLPSYFVVNDYGMDNIIRYESWQQVGERMVPREISVWNGARESSRFMMDSYRPDYEVEDADYAPPPDRIDLSYRAEGAGMVNVLRGRWGHHFVQPLINGRSVGWVAIDTGASMTVIDSRIADYLDLEIIGESSATGVGGMIEEKLAMVDAITLGPLTIRRMPVKVGDMKKLDLGIEDEMGLLAMDFLRHCVIDYDQAGSRVALYDPNAYELSDGEWMPMFDHNGKPTVWMPFEGHRGLFTIDTGNPGAVLIGWPTVERYGLLEGRHTTPGYVSGIGGRVRAEHGEFKWVEWGGRRFEDVPVRFVTENRGSGSDRSRDGIIGTDLLRHFRVVFDPHHGRIAFLSNDG